jgi:hypothetical protein
MKVSLLCIVQLFLQGGQPKMVLQRRLLLRLDDYNKDIAKRLTYCEMGAQSHGSASMISADRQTTEFLAQAVFVLQRRCQVINNRK